MIINDYIELIDLADGLHLGQEDLLNINKYQDIAIKIIRDKIKDKILGISTHNLDEILKSNTLNIDYIGLGAYRDTSTKKDAKTSGKKLLDIAKNSTHKVALIGGVRLEDNFDSYPQIYYKVIGSNLTDKFLKS